MDDLLGLIQETALTLDTEKYPEIAQLFITFYQEKDTDIHGALERLNFALGQYQWNNHFQAPDNVAKIRLMIKETQNIRHGAGMSAAMFPIWFGN
ncbi:hypothetical protein OIT44_05355 [Weissella ceti]|uniref:Bacteriocin immunity protein n=1 Tax=Weissella ceti TaxID=759620 RepID=A0ABT3E4Y4_9LACO|nr:hypothetical protein [Weissella ceti]MCW0953496.1 hypothetical protein [Weissella ceti]QVK12083.1 hypothetical protein KHQ31_07730 [Weissella ceti]